jgi:hypothetical protein
MRTGCVLFVFLISCGMACVGQDMVPQYNMYVSRSVDNNGILSQTVIVDGYTSGNCSQGIICVGMSHTASITNTLGAAGGTETDQPNSPVAYISYQTTTSVQVESLLDIQATAEGTVVCTSAGAIFYARSTDLVSIRDTYFGPPPII